MSGTTTPHAKITFAALDQLPEGVSGEILNGGLYTSPRPTGPALLAQHRLTYLLTGPFDVGQGGPGGWWILQEPQLYLEADSLIPDLAGWRREKMPQLPQDHRFELAPDWVCEVLSPDRKGRRTDTQLKPPIYHREKVGHLWILDPRDRALEVFRREEAGWLLLGKFGEEDKVRVAPFEETELDLLALWG
jgi:Uma2 family endonuclease